MASSKPRVTRVSLMLMSIVPKIADEDLQIFAQDDEAEALRSVIIELKASPADLSIQQKPSSPRGVNERRLIINSGPRQAQNEKEAMDKLERDLSALGLGDLVRLDSASAFVARVSPGQLREVSYLPTVGIIRPNRTHRIPRR